MHKSPLERSYARLVSVRASRKGVYTSRGERRIGAIALLRERARVPKGGGVERADERRWDAAPARVEQAADQDYGAMISQLSLSLAMNCAGVRTHCCQIGRTAARATPCTAA